MSDQAPPGLRSIDDPAEPRGPLLPTDYEPAAPARTTSPAQSDPSAPPGVRSLQPVTADQRDGLANFIAASRNPTGELAKQEVVEYLHLLTGEEKATLYNNYAQIVRDYTGADIEPVALRDAARQWWSNSQSAYQANLLKQQLFDQIAAGRPVGDLPERITDLESRMVDADVLSRNPLANWALKPAIENISMMIDPMLQGASVGTAAALGAGLAGVAFAPVTGGASLTIPAVTVGLIGTASGTSATAVRSSQIQRAELMWELYQVTDEAGNRIDPALATTLSAIGGGIQGLIESIQITQYMPGGQQIFSGVVNRFTEKLYANRFLRNRAAQLLVRYGTNVNDEALEEAQQQVATEVVRQLAIDLENAGGAEFDRRGFEEAARNVLDSYVQGFAASTILSAPGSILTRGEGTQETPDRPARRSIAQEQREQLTEGMQTEQDPDDTPPRPAAEIEEEYRQMLDQFEQNPDESARRIMELSDELERAEQIERTEVPEPEAVDGGERPLWEMRRDEWLQQQPEDSQETPTSTTRELSEAGQTIRSRVLEETPNATEVEADLVAELFERRAEARGITPDQYLQEFDPRIAGEAQQVLDETRPGRVMPQDKKGFLAYTQEARAIIGLTERSDFSTWVHELGHKFRTELDQDLQQTAANYYGVVDGRWTEDQEEAFTEDLTTWFMTGEAPNEEIKPFLERVGEYLKRIYRTLAGRAQVSDDIASVFEQILTPRERPQQTAMAEQPGPRSAGGPRVEDVAVAELALSRDVPQFKADADTETGVVEPLESERYERLGTAPIVVWERSDGRQEVITGRHRLDLARRLGEETIPAQIVRESEGFTLDMARTFDAESNIRDGQGTIDDYVTYFREAGVSRGEAERRGLLSREKAQTAFAIAAYASDELYSLYRNNRISAVKARAIAEAAPGMADVQRSAIPRARELSAQELSNFTVLMRQYEASPEARQQDMFGGDDSAIVEAERMAKEAARMAGEQATELATLRQAVRVSQGQRAELVEQYGLKPGDVDAMQTRIAELSDQVATWQEWYSDPALFNEVRRSLGLSVTEDVELDMGDPAPEFEEDPAQEALFQTRSAPEIVLERVAELRRQLASDEPIAIIPSREEQRRTQVARELRIFEQFGENGLMLRSTSRPEQYAIIHRSTRPEFEWQISYFDERGPFGDTKYESFSSLARDIGMELSWGWEPERSAGERFSERTLFQTAPAVETKAFWDWFDDSKVVDENGDPLVIYHGSADPDGITEFDKGRRGQSTGARSAQKGFFFTSRADVAADFARLAHRRGVGEAESVTPVYVSMQNPLVVDKIEGRLFGGINDAVERAISGGHDGVIIRQVGDAPQVIPETMPQLVIGGEVVDGAPDITDTDVIAMIEFWQDPMNYPSEEAQDRAANAITSELTDTVEYYEEQLADPEGNGLTERDLEEFQNQLEAWKKVLRAWEADPESIKTQANNLSDIYVAFEPTQIKSAIANRGTFDPTEANILFQPSEPDQHEQAVEQAVTEGQWVPDEVLRDYSDRDWSRAELANRQVLRQQAQESVNAGETIAEFVEMQQTFDMDDHSVVYWRAIYNSATRVEPKTQDQLADEWVAGLSKPALSAYLHTVKANFAADDLPHGVVASITKGLGESQELTDEHYGIIMSQIRSRPIDWFETLSALTEADEDLRLMDEAAKAHPEESRLRQLQKQIDSMREKDKRLDRDVESLQQQIRLDQKYERDLTGKIAELEQEQTDREQALGEALDSARKEARAMARVQRQEQRQALIEERARVRRSIREQQQVRDYVKRLIKDIMRRPSASTEYSFAQRIIEIQDGLDARSFRRGKIGQMRKVLRERLPDISDEALRLILEVELGKVSLRDMGLVELESLHQEIMALREAGRQALQQKVEEQRRQDMIDVQRLVTELGGSAFLQNLGTKRSRQATESSLLTKGKFNIYSMQRITDGLGETWKELFWNEINRRTDEKLRHKYSKIERYRALQEQTGVTTRALMEDLTDGLTINEAVAIHIYLQNEDSAAAIRNGNFVTAENLAAVREFMKENANYRAFADGLMALFDDESFDRLNEVFVEYSNSAMQRVEKYFPMRRQQLGDTPFETELQEDLLSRTHGGKTYAWRGFTHSRKHVRRQGQAPLRLDAVNVALEGFEKQEHFAAMAGHIKRLHRILRNRSVQEAFVGKFGRDAYNTMVEYTNRIANPSVHRAQTTAGRFFQDLRGNMTVGALAFNLTSPIKNLVGPLLYLPHISNNPLEAVGRMVASMWTAIVDKDVREFIRESDPQVRERALDPALREAEELSRIGNNKVRMMLQKIGMAPLQLVDSWTVIAGEHAVYTAARARGLDHEAAVAQMQEATLRTQPFSQEKDTPAIYTDNTAKMFLMFSSPLNQIFGMVTHDMPQMVREGRAASAALVIMALVLTGVGLRSIGRKRPPEDPEEWVKDVVSQFIEMIPFFGSEIMMAIDKNPFAGRGVSVTQPFVEGTRAVQRLIDPDTDPRVKWNGAVRAATESMRMVGLPGVQVNRLYRTFVNDTGGIDPWQLVGGGPEE